ncbi:hypothetical protein FSP39_014546 [Pinctada imbricata]|uniref:Reverse transcriptase domain-containing protein n=1 Tax=Pinctada imbricata TaxID=66713 RepID=A0AA88XUD4_PINIB|nr:hypothetical protein FSP39_014546 [Pinctada imbricata]
MSISIANDKVFSSPIRHLRERINVCVKTGANDHVVKVNEEGYRLPLKSTPDEVLLKKNNSARDNPQFVSQEVQNLVHKRCISQVITKPKVVKPLTVAYNQVRKARLVLDCRHINTHLYQFKFKYEDGNVVRSVFEKGDHLLSYDLKSAYHHVIIHPDDRTCLGFEWEGKFYVYNVLSFGLETAGFISSKIMREIVKYWRENSMKIIMYLDDGLGGGSTFEESKTQSERVRNDLIKFGFLIADEKCSWEPSQTLVWLGLVWDTREGKLMVTQKRLHKIIKSIGEFLGTMVRTKQRLVKVKHLASIVGHLISTQCVLGNAVRLKTRYSYDCILSRASWNAPVVVSNEDENEMKLWLNNIESFNRKGSELHNSKCEEVCDAKLFCDASGEGLRITENVEVTVLHSGVKPGTALHNLASKITDYLVQSKSKNTTKGYFNAFKRWERYITSQGFCGLPANPIHVSLYITYLLESGASDHTVNSAI